MAFGRKSVCDSMKLGKELILKWYLEIDNVVHPTEQANVPLNIAQSLPRLS